MFNPWAVNKALILKYKWTFIINSLAYMFEMNGYGAILIYVFPYAFLCNLAMYNASLF